LLVQAHGIEVAAFYSRDLCSDERGTVFKVLWAVLCPYFQTLVVSGQSIEMLLSSVSRCRIIGCRMGQRAIKLVLSEFKKNW